uniref:AlNc14C268G9917 protein n=1 Tax=Albugo laibachii Nc14 TaxID=890382 RepID=F0WU96_9STRA|nr:AlNc14C268G9917 [Albugo laibachii Nc14]|eukprot:CCA24974.1 AlNc14C268G9917 [Albugo laibachii Nc14]
MQKTQDEIYPSMHAIPCKSFRRPIGYFLHKMPLISKIATARVGEADGSDSIVRTEVAQRKKTSTCDILQNSISIYESYINSPKCTTAHRPYRCRSF